MVDDVEIKSSPTPTKEKNDIISDDGDNERCNSCVGLQDAWSDSKSRNEAAKGAQGRSK